MTTKAASTGGKSRTKPRGRRISPSDPAAHILDAPKGVRVVSHRELKAAVDKVFRERRDANG